MTIIAVFWHNISWSFRGNGMLEESSYGAAIARIETSLIFIVYLYLI